MGPFLLVALLGAAAAARQGADAPAGACDDPALAALHAGAVPLAADGEPQVSVGLAPGAAEVVLLARTALRAHFCADGHAKTARIPAGARVTVARLRAVAAPRQHYVDLGSVVPPTPAAAARAVARWRQAGLATARAVADGQRLQLGKAVVDSRTRHVIWPARGAAQARRRAAWASAHFAQPLPARSRLNGRPRGELALRVDGVPIARARDGVRLVPEAGGSLDLARVEYGRGYSWHGHEARTYRGSIAVTLDADGLLVPVNVIGAEALLEGVVPAEMFASGPPAALQAQAVAARNVLLAKLGRRHRDAPYHVCAEQHCQVYAGVGHEHPRTTAAVRATRGQVLFHRGALVDAVYSASCGGFTEDNDAVWGDAPSPALRGRSDLVPAATAAAAAFTGPARADAVLTEAALPAFLAAAPQSYCAAGAPPGERRLRWQRTLNAEQLAAVVARGAPEIGELLGLRVLQRGPGGRAVALALRGTRGTRVVRHELPIRQLFDNLHSAAFIVAEQRDAAGRLRQVTFKGGGWGHGVGLCQLGAMGRARAGHSARAILAHYYNGAELHTLWRPHP